jgi:hypothetical protein
MQEHRLAESVLRKRGDGLTGKDGAVRSSCWWLIGWAAVSEAEKLIGEASCSAVMAMNRGIDEWGPDLSG